MAIKEVGNGVTSSTEAKYQAIATIVEEMEAVGNLLKELGIVGMTVMTLFSDNQGAMFVANNPICHMKLHHVSMDLHIVRE